MGSNARGAGRKAPSCNAKTKVATSQASTNRPKPARSRRERGRRRNASDRPWPSRRANRPAAPTSELQGVEARDAAMAVRGRVVGARRGVVLEAVHQHGVEAGVARGIELLDHVGEEHRVATLATEL